MYDTEMEIAAAPELQEMAVEEWLEYAVVVERWMSIWQRGVITGAVQKKRTGSGFTIRGRIVLHRSCNKVELMQ